VSFATPALFKNTEATIARKANSIRIGALELELGAFGELGIGLIPPTSEPMD